MKPRRSFRVVVAGAQARCRSWHSALLRSPCDNRQWLFESQLLRHRTCVCGEVHSRVESADGRERNSIGRSGGHDSRRNEVSRSHGSIVPSARTSGRARVRLHAWYPRNTLLCGNTRPLVQKYLAAHGFAPAESSNHAAWDQAGQQCQDAHMPLRLAAASDTHIPPVGDRLAGVQVPGDIA